MSAAVFCPGCGATVAVPEGYTRNKMRCPECGVMIAVERGAAPVAAPKKRAPAIAASPAGRTCADCGQPLPAGVAVCPECAAAATLAGLSVPQRSKPAPLPAAESMPEAPLPDSPAFPSTTAPLQDDEDNGAPYEVSASDRERRCPACARVLEGPEVVCPGCDFDLVHGRQSVRVWPKVERQWDSGASPQLRWTLFLVTLSFFLLGAVVGAVMTGDIFTFVGPALLFAGMISFLLGTWFRTEVTRNPKGRVRITLTTFICFVARTPQVLRLGEYEGVLSGKVNENKFYEWLLMLIFIPSVIGMVLWWYYIIHKDSFFVALTRQHGFPDQLVYRGWSQETMKEVEKVMREVAGLLH
jgi:hypothetical protein